MSEDAIGQMFEKAQGKVVTVNLKFNDGSNFAGMRLSRGVMLIAHETEHVCFCSVRWAVLAGLEGTSWCPASDDAVVGACNGGAGKPQLHKSQKQLQLHLKCTHVQGQFLLTFSQLCGKI